MGRLWRYLLYLALAAAAGFAVYAGFAELPAPLAPVEVDAPPPAPRT